MSDSNDKNVIDMSQAFEKNLTPSCDCCSSTNFIGSTIALNLGELGSRHVLICTECLTRAINKNMQVASDFIAQLEEEGRLE